VKQTDASVYIQDEWKLRPNFTISPGLRYENQNNIDSNFNFATRIACAVVAGLLDIKKSRPPWLRNPLL
jgi:outer membrane receptor for ferrienterochelin and colicin